MPIISVEIMKIIDERETWGEKAKKITRGTNALVKRWELNDFGVHFCSIDM